MKNSNIKVMKGVFLVTSMFITCYLGVSFADEGPRTLKVKGCYLGMDIEDTKKIIEKYTDKEVTIRKYGKKYYLSSENSSAWSGLDKKVIYIIFHCPLVDKIFNTSAISARRFVEEFRNAYSIPAMTRTYVEVINDYAWVFESPYGYKLLIGDHKWVSITKIPPRSSFKFD